MGRVQTHKTNDILPKFRFSGSLHWYVYFYNKKIHYNCSSSNYAVIILQNTKTTNGLKLPSNLKGVTSNVWLLTQGCFVEAKSCQVDLRLDYQPYCFIRGVYRGINVNDLIDFLFEKSFLENIIFKLKIIFFFRFLKKNMTFKFSKKCIKLTKIVFDLI